jgi:hypothetical protein
MAIEYRSYTGVNRSKKPGRNESEVRPSSGHSCPAYAESGMPQDGRQEPPLHLHRRNLFHRDPS